MRNLIVAIIAVLALACAQYVPQPGPLNIITVTNGTFYDNLFLPIQPSVYYGYHVNLYKIYVPENTSSIILFFNNTYPDSEDDSCEALSIAIGNNGFVPCNEEEYSEEIYPCSNSEGEDDVYNDEGGVFLISSPDYYTTGDGSTTTWSVDSWWYMSVSRYYPDDYNVACTYQLQVTLNSSCNTGEIAEVSNLDLEYDGPFGCSPAYNFLNASTGTWNVSSTEQAVFKVNVPTSTVGWISITATSNSEGLDIYGGSYSAPNDEYYACSVDDYTSEVGGVYTYNLNCYTPRIGSFFIVFYNDIDDGEDYPAFNALVTIDVHDCGSGGLGGYNCSFPVVACNSSWNAFAVNIPYTEAQDELYLSGVWWYCYIDIPANGSALLWNLLITVPTGSSDNSYFTSLRKNGFNEYEEYGNNGGDEVFITEIDAGETTEIGLSPFEIYEAGRFYVGLLCYDPIEGTTGCTFTISANTTVAPTTSGTSSTGSGTTTTGGTGATTTTTGNTGVVTTSTNGVFTTHTNPTSTASTAPASTTASTGGKTSSGVIVVPSIFFVIAAFVTLFV